MVGRRYVNSALEKINRYEDISDGTRTAFTEIWLQNKDMLFGTWNLRFLLQAGDMIIIGEEAESYKMDVVALQQVWWRGLGLIRNSNFILYYSGDVRQGYQGVGFTFSKKGSKSVLGFSPICDKICILRIKGKFRKITQNIETWCYHKSRSLQCQTWQGKIIQRLYWKTHSSRCHNQ